MTEEGGKALSRCRKGEFHFMRRYCLIYTFITLMIALGWVYRVEADYFDGHQLAAFSSSQNPLEVAIYRGYVGGIQDTFNGGLVFQEANRPAQLITFFCVPPNVKMSQTAAIVTKYLTEHPEEWHKPGEMIVILALAKAFPLKNSQCSKSQ